MTTISKPWQLDLTTLSHFGTLATLVGTDFTPSLEDFKVVFFETIDLT